MSTIVSYQTVEDLLLKAARVPEVLHTVVGLVWCSVVNNVRDSLPEEVVAAAAAFDDEGLDTALCTHNPQSGTQVSSEGLAPLLPETSTSEAVSVVGWHEWMNATKCSLPPENVTGVYPSAPATAQVITPAAASSVDFAPGLSSLSPGMTRSAPVVELSPLILRVLLWWAGRPQLPLRGSERTGNAAEQIASLSCVSCNSEGNVTASGFPVEGCDSLHLLLDKRGTGDAVQRERKGDPMSAQLLRLRIADIFALLCRYGGDAAVSDALLYDRCHTGSRLVAQRCHIVFGGFSEERWRTATSSAPTPSTPLGLAAGMTSAESSVSPHFDHDGVGVRGGAHDMNQMLCALVDLHTCAVSTPRIPQTGLPPHFTPEAIAETDVIATGVLLRALLRCPPLHKRIVRLLDGDVHATEWHNHGQGTSAVAVTPLSALSMQICSTCLLPSASPSSGIVHRVDPRRHLHIFLPVLTHASPILSAESWQTLTVLLFPSSGEVFSCSVRRLLLRAPECPLQHLLAATLALPEDEADNRRLRGLPDPQSALISSSHPMARNNALQLLHVLCTSTNVPPTVQLCFHQSPALLWRVLRLAATICKGIAVAHVALVRRVLADYVMSSLQQHCSEDYTADSRNRCRVSTQTLLRENRDALTRFLSSSYAAWEGGARFSAPEDAGGEWASVDTTTSASTEKGYDENQVLAILDAL